MSESQHEDRDGSDVPFDPYNFDPEKDVSSSSRRLVERLLARVPDLRPAYDEHIADYDVSLPHLFFADVTRWTVADFEANGDRTSGGWRDVVAFLEEEYDHSDYDAQAVIEQSFVENLPHPGQPAEGIVQRLGPRLKAIYDQQRGLS